MSHNILEDLFCAGLGAAGMTIFNAIRKSRSVGRQGGADLMARFDSALETAVSQRREAPAQEITQQAAEIQVHPGMPVAANKTVELLLSFVDLYDELLPVSSDQCPVPSTINIARERIRHRIELFDGEIIEDTDWNPDRQRAVEVRQACPDTSFTVIVGSRASGLLIGGKLCRKQEVIISKPTTP